MAQADSPTAELMLTEPLRIAIDHAFREAQTCLREDGSLVPFTIICTSDGYDIADHPGASTDEIYESVRTLMAREIPPAYAFVYDGFVDTDEGRRDALICEAAKRGDATAYLLAQLYTAGEDGFTLEQLLGDDSETERVLERVSLREAIDHLPERERQVISLRYFHDMTQDAAARVIGVSQVQVSRLERRAIATLREWLE